MSRLLLFAIASATVMSFTDNIAFSNENCVASFHNGNGKGDHAVTSIEQQGERPAGHERIRLAAGKGNGVDLHAIALETHQFSELIAADPEKNLAYRHPAVVMNGPQQVYAWFMSEKPQRIYDPSIKGRMTTMYPTISVASPRNGNQMIIGQHYAINAFMDAVAAAASGDGSKSTVILFEGSSGTGKTAFLDIAYKLASHLTQTKDEYMRFTFEWRNLEQIPAMHPILDIQPGDDLSNFSHIKIRSETRTSPFALLPKEYQEEVVRMAYPRVKALIGTKPLPNSTLNPKDEWYLGEIVKYYAKKKGSALSADEIIDVLDKHVVIVRDVIDTKKGQGRIEYQGRDINWSALTYAEDPLLQRNIQFGPSHPMSFHLNGAITGGGSFVAWDELLRNQEALLDFVLGVWESGIVEKGGPRVPVDAFTIAISNTEILEKRRSEVGYKAILDRLHLVPMMRETHPVKVLETLLYMHNVEGIKQIPLKQALEERGVDGAKQADEEIITEPLSLIDVFPFQTSSHDPLRSLNRRFAILFEGRGEEPDVFVSPHALEYLAEVAAASRLEIDQSKAVKFGAYAVIGDPVFTDPVRRLKAILGEIEVDSPSRGDLATLAGKMKEGSHGISPRNVSRIWLKKCIEVARRPEHKFTLSVQVVQQAFLELSTNNELEAKDAKEMKAWEALLKEFAYARVLPKIRTDLTSAIASQGGVVEQTYDQVFRELLTLATNPSATEYDDEHGASRPIDGKRLEEVKRLYKESERRELPVNQIINFAASLKRDNAGARHRGLLHAIQAYYAAAVLKQISIEGLASYARTRNGPDQVRNRFEPLMSYMRDELGYNEQSVVDALNLVESQSNHESKPR